MNEKKIIKLDGSVGEGGGSIIRLSAGFSTLFNQPIHITNIRANRQKPGLRQQHLLGLKTLAELTESNLSQCEVGSSEITLIPGGSIQKSEIDVNVNTAASLGLLLQPIQIASLSMKKSQVLLVRLHGGGTFGKWAPSLDYLKDVTYSVFKKAGLNIDININRHGFYPKGGAEVHCSISMGTNSLKPINMVNLGNIEQINGEIILSNHFQNKNNIGERIKNTIIGEIKKYHQHVNVNVNCRYVSTHSQGLGLYLWANSDTSAIISTGTILGEKQITSEQLGKLAVKELTKYIKNDIPVDKYLSDQLIPLMVYLKSSSSMKVLEITSHTQTNLDLIKKFSKRNYNIRKENVGYCIEFD
ncbi:MAG: RNA 3'-terminal phosphate cyclase [Candidatus Lokiarchaeota archaeon]|nr:RNA 3'-terminal phosphate cyclase [Candidatus Lokiarchaeota archaeon]